MPNQILLSFALRGYVNALYSNSYNNCSSEQLSVKQVAELFNVSEFTIYRWAKSCKIPCYSIGRIIRFETKYWWIGYTIDLYVLYTNNINRRVYRQKAK